MLDMLENEFQDGCNEIIERGTEEETIEDIDIRACKFSTYGGDFIIRQLVEMLEESEIEIPKIQRHYVWTNKIASRFIESILLDLPLPSIFLAKNEKGRFVIIDGLQRLTTLYNYIVKGISSGKTFKLSTSKDIRKEWRGKSFNELTEEDQRRLKNKLIHAIIVEQKEPSNFDGLFLIFERINTGGLQLNQQEIRNAIFQNDLNTAINKMNSYKKWRVLFGQEEPHARMRDNEMILRFLALSNIDILNYKNDSLNMVSALNAFMSNKSYNKETFIENCDKKFTKTIDVVYDMFGRDVFRTNIQTMQVSQKFYATVFDAVMIATYYAMENNFDFKTLKKEKSKINDLFQNNNFKFACSAHTTDLSAIKSRIKEACKCLYGLTYEN